MNILGLARHGLNDFEQIAIILVVVTAFLSLAYAWWLRGKVLSKDKGTAKMQEVWNAIRIGADSYLNRQLRTILPLIGVLTVLMFLSVYVVPPSHEAEAEFGAESAQIIVAIGRTIAFIMGASFSLMVGQLGMRMAIQANVRAASAARRGFNEALSIAYYAGTITGMLTDGLGLFGGTIIFIIFGTFLEMSGSGAVLMDLGKALTGRYRGGPAKIAVLTSAFFGTISGSAAANVYATGSFTIPMMKKAGYDPAFAGAVEASASTGGQIMPPVMGAAAFLMADILGIPYLQVCKAALIPAVLYFFSLLIMVDFEAARKGLRGVGPEELPSLKATLKRSYLLLPIGVLLAAMIWGYTPFRAAFLATVSTVVISFFSRKERMGIRTILKALVVSGQRTVLIATACGVAGIIIGVVTLTGIGLNISSVIISASGGIRIIGLVLIMISSIIMGMGTPTTVAYVIVATLGVPALGKLGFDVLPSHFFVFYFGVLSMVTPPVAVAAYAAAEISGENMMKIGLRATKLCFVAFIIPFAFMYEPGLLMLGSWPTIAMEFSTAAIGIVGLAASFHAWLWVPIGWLFRVLFFAAALLLITPGFQTNFMGLGLFLILVAWLYYKKGRKANFSPLE